MPIPPPPPPPPGPPPPPTFGQVGLCGLLGGRHGLSLMVLLSGASALSLDSSSPPCKSFG